MRTPVALARFFDVDSFLLDSRSFPKQSYTLHARVPIHRADQGLNAVMQVRTQH